MRISAARLSVLGRVELTWEHQPVRISGSAQRILAMLAIVHRGEPVDRTVLAERLWPDTSPDRAASNLRSALWRMPRLRGRPVVTPGSSTVRLAPDLAVDLWEGERQAIALCQDPSPADEHLRDLRLLCCDLLPTWYDEWVLVEQESYRQHRLHALERGSTLLRERGRYTEALMAALAAVRCEPLRESAHRRVIEVHLDEGNPSEALRQYDAYRRLVAHELGIAPSPAIRGLVAPLLGRPVDVAHHAAVRHRRRPTAGR